MARVIVYTAKYHAQYISGGWRGGRNWPGIQMQVVWGVFLLMDEELIVPQKCTLRAQKDNRALGCIQSGVGSRTREWGNVPPALLW